MEEWMKTPRAMMAAFLLLASPPLLAQEVAEADGTPSRTINLMVYGNDTCPEAESPDEIVVCGRLPETERYRIPKELRTKEEDPGAPGTSWTTQMEMLNQDMRYTRPDSCSAVGSGGQTGCYQQRLDQWRAERRAR
jgi:hypothetical protein